MRMNLGLLLVISSVALTWDALAFDSTQGEPWGRIFFDTDSDKVGSYEFPKVSDQDRVKLVGHADRRWTESHNLDLSERRAKAVALAIGRPDAEILAKGASQPISDCLKDDEHCLMEDRRVDIYLECGLSNFACTSDYPKTWMGNVKPEYSPVRMVTDRSRF